MARAAVAPAVAHLVRGDDASLVAQAAHDLLVGLAGDEDLSMVVEEHGAAGAEDIDVGAVVDALATPPFLSATRIVVVREAGRLVAADAVRLTEWLAAPVPGVVLVLVAGGGTIPAALVKTVERQGAVSDFPLAFARRSRRLPRQELTTGRRRSRFPFA